MTEDAVDESGAYHHHSGQPDRVEFTCSECRERVNRPVNQMDIEGIPPSRCVTCTLELMAQ